MEDFSFPWIVGFERKRNENKRFRLYIYHTFYYINASFIVGLLTHGNNDRHETFILNGITNTLDCVSIYDDPL